MNILFLGNFSGGGTEKVTFNLANALNSAGNKIYILSTSSLAPSFYLSEIIEYKQVGVGSVASRNIEIYKYCKSKRVDVIVAVEAMSSLFSLVSALLLGCRHIVWEHANYYQNQGSKHINAVRRIGYRLSDAYIVLTKRDYNNFVNHNYNEKKLYQIYNFIDDNIDYKYDVESKIIISVGHIRDIKNFNIIPEIAKVVFDKHPDWKWKIYGEKGDGYEELEKKIKNYGLGDHVIMCGRSNNMDIEYAKSSIYVLTSLQEGLPMAMLEAKKHKIPIVSFNIETGPDEIIMDGVNGLLVEQNNISEMIEKIMMLIEDERKRVSLSSNSFVGIDRFDKECIVKEWLALLGEVFSENAN